MGTFLKTDFDWVIKNNELIIVYSDHARYIRESLVANDFSTITPHNAIKLCKAKNIKIDLRRVNTSDKLKIKNILIEQGIHSELILT